MIDTFSYEKIEMVFSNLSFVSLFVAMLAYWSDLSERFVRRDERRNPTVDDNAVGGTPFAGRASASFEASLSAKDVGDSRSFGRETFGTALLPEILNSEEALTIRPYTQPSSARIGFWSVVAANFALFLLLTLRWFESGHFPLSNLYESLLFLTWTLTFFHILLRRTMSDETDSVGSITAPTALFVDAFANFSLPADMQRASALVPALKSNWLMMHVTVMILSYGALIFGSLLAIGFLIVTARIPSSEFGLSKKSIEPNEARFSTTRLEWAETLDNLSYRLLGIGFPLLTVGILSGAVWANEAWGSYWSWDPKETWALLTWFVFAIYLHTRITKNWQGKKPAMIASFGFFMVWVCYLGVNLLGEGLHSYGWLKS